MSFQNKKYIIMSTGSCGSHYLYEFLEECYGNIFFNNVINIKKEGNTNSHNTDKEKFYVDTDVKFLYIYRNPIDSIVSFYNKSKGTRKPGNFARRHCKKIRGDYVGMSTKWTVGKYFIKINRDLFCFSDHYSFFMHERKKIRIYIYIKYEYFYKHIDEILNFLEIDEDFKTRFKWSSGTSSCCSLSNKELWQAKKIYKNELIKYNSYPEFATNSKV